MDIRQRVISAATGCQLLEGIGGVCHKVEG